MTSRRQAGLHLLVLGALVIAACAAASIQPGATAAPVTFVLLNQTGRDIYIQVSGGAGQEYWRLSRTGRSIQASARCDVCHCGVPCAVCGRELATVQRIEPGVSHAWTWDGTEWSLVGPPGQQCQEGRRAAPGEYRVTVSYSFAARVERQLGAEDTFVGPTISASETFTHPAETRVRLVAR